jgi:heptosyltransferase-3
VSTDPGEIGVTRSILLVTLSNIGDAVMTTPVLQALHNRYPQALVDIVADPRSSLLFRHCPWRRNTILKHKQAGWRGLAGLVRELRANRYDLIVDLRTDGLTLLLRARQRLTRRGCRSAGRHAVERHFCVLRQRESPGAIPPARVWLSAAEHDFARQALAGLPGRRWLALGPGARGEAKRWPTGQFSALALQLQPQFDAVILLGSPNEAGTCRQVAAGLTLPSRVLAGKTDLLQAAAVLAKARLFVGNDSGLGHLAAACSVPTVTVFGPGDPARYHPWHTAARWVQSTSGSITDVGVEEVLEQVLAELGTQVKSKN